MKKLILMLASGFIILSFAGFAGTAQAQETGKIMKLAMDADPVSLDPHVQLSGGMLQYSHMVFDPLVRWTKSMEFEPRLAVKWERINDTTMRFFCVKM